jgi:Ca-activated chloride channel homolog
MKKAASTYRLWPTGILLIVAEVLFWLITIGVFFALHRFIPNIQFHHEWAAWMLVCLPLLALIFFIVLRIKNKAFGRFTSESMASVVSPNRSAWRSVFKFLLFRSMLAFVIFAALDPKIGSKLEEVETKSADLMIALDVSSSMEAEDIKPNRLEVAKLTVERLIKQLKGDRIGIVIFAGDAYVQLPLTQDYAAAKIFLDGISTNSVGTQGTSIGLAIDLCMESFDPTSETARAILIFTDGENHEDDAVRAAKDAAAQNIVVHTFGMGSLNGAPIPLYDRYGNSVGFKEDAQGNPIVTALNERLLVEISSAANGIFTRASSSMVSLNSVLNSLDELEKTEVNNLQFSDYQHRFQWFLFPAILLIILDMLIVERKPAWIQKFKILGS